MTLNTNPISSPTPLNAGIWRELISVSDAITTTKFDLDTGVLSRTFDMYRILAIIENQHSGTNDIKINVNNNFTLNYVYSSPGSVAGSVDTSWLLQKIQDGSYLMFDAIVRGSFLVNPTNQRPSIIVNGVEGMDSGDIQAIYAGTLNANIPTINRLRIQSEDGNATGRLKLFGFNF